MVMPKYGIVLLIIIFILIGIYLFMFKTSGKSYRGPFIPLSKQEELTARQAKEHVYFLAKELGERNIWHINNLNQAADYIEKNFSRYGYNVYVQSFLAQQVNVKNIIAEQRGTLNPEEIIIIGAHYDSVLGSPGADDNASGVAALLELARQLKDTPFKRTIRFVAFVNEEPPFFQGPQIGSFYYARSLKAKNEKVVAMLSLESIGFYSDEKNSQQYPPPFNTIYPDTANFIGFVANLSSRNLLQQVIASFRGQVQFPTEGLVAPASVVGVGWSDQWSFWQEGYRAIMVTGTALFRNPHYHKSSDLPNTIDYPRLARVIHGLNAVILHLSQR